jgi:hypothetical protein
VRRDVSLAKCVVRKRPLILACVVGALVCGILLALSVPVARRHAESVTCGNLMSSIGCGALTWALDNSNHLASDFRSMSNELCSPRFLLCPSDHNRNPARGWESVDQTNCSYEIIAPGMSADDRTNAYFRCKIHGHVGFADGTVFDGKRRRTKVMW